MQVRRAFLTLLALLAVVDVRLMAHAGLRFSSPMEGATLGDTPAAVQLTLGERPEPGLSEIHVADTAGAAYEIGRPTLVPGDPTALSIGVRPLATGVYIVNWRVVSAVDGHVSAGSFAFGVRASPSGVATKNATAAISGMEVGARLLLVLGLVVIIGASAASVARFGGRGDLLFAAAGWAVSAIGLALVGWAQKRNTSVPFADLLATAVGRALVWRAVALGAAAIALTAAYWSGQSSRLRAHSLAMAATLVAALAAVAVHVAAGHAAAGPIADVVMQWAHVVASGVWIGGLAALLAGLPSASIETRATSIRRFSSIAGIGIAVVAATGTWRAVNELVSWNDLTATAYGRLVFLKLALFGVIAVLGALNRWRHVRIAHVALRPLRMAAGGELVLAAAALAAAAFLGTLPPPASSGIPGIRAAGTDYGTTVRVSLAAASDQPGPNRFTARIVDYDSKTPIRDARVALRFTPIDDAGVAPTMLRLAPETNGAYGGSGANLAFPGRWRVVALVERDRDSREVPMEVEVRSPPQFVSIQRNPGEPPMYTVEAKGIGHIRFAPDPERAGPSKVRVTCFNGIFEDRPTDRITVTAGDGTRPPATVAVHRLDRSRFIADVEFRPGRNRLTAIAWAVDGSRMQASVDIDVPSR